MSVEYSICILGPSFVGKSSIVVRFVQRKFIDKYDPTIEDTYRKFIEVDGQGCMFDIMDTAGQEEFSALRDQYMKKGDGFLLIFSIISKDSFEQVKQLRNHILRSKESTDFPIILVGNKQDLEKQREISKEDILSDIKEWNIPYIETSAKTDYNIDEIFITLAREINKWRKLHLKENQYLKKKSNKSSCILI